MKRIFGALTVTWLVTSALCAATVTTYPVGTLLENIAILQNGNLFVTSIDD